MKKTTIAVAAGLMVAFASASQAQFGGYQLSYTLGYSSFTGCNVGPAMLTLPGGAVYYVPGTGPGTGGISVGVCWFGPTNGNGYVGPTGWIGLGYTPPPPPSTYNDDDDDDSNANNDEELPRNIHLVNSTDDHQGDNNQGDNNDGGNHEGGGGPGVTITELPTTTTPEPASFFLVSSGLAGLAVLGWRRRKR